MNYQPFFNKWKTPFAGAAIWLCLASSYALAQTPQWWITRGVLDQNSAPQDYAPINQGQLKWLAISAYDEMNAYFGADSNVASVVNAFSPSNNYFPVNIGQVKYLATPFYDRLYEFDLTNTMPPGMQGHYPWDGRPQTNDYAMVNIGQAKYVFSFDSAKDSDGEGLSDWQEAVYGTNPYNSDTDGDGLSDSWEVNHGYDPLDDGDANEALVREAARQNILRHWMLFNGWRFEFTNAPGSAADLDDMKWALNLLSSKFYTVEFTHPTYETLYYHLNRAFTPVEIYIEGTPTVYQLYTESEKLTDIVKGLALQFDTTNTYAVERNAAAICYTTATGAWNVAVNYNNERRHDVRIFDNCGWVGGTTTTNGEWGAYFWTLQNHLAFQTSESDWWRHIDPTGVFVKITNVFVGSIGNFPPGTKVVDIGPSLYLATNYPGADCWDAWEYKVDISNIFYQVAIPDIWITPRDAKTSVGGGNVQYTVTGANIPTGVTWTTIPVLTNGAEIYPSNDWHYASVTPGSVATNYKVRATSKDNTNFYDEVNLNVWKIDIVETNIYIAVSNTISLHLTPDSSVDAQWQVIPSVQTGAYIQGSSVGTSVVINAGSIPTNYIVKAYAPDFTNCCDTCTVTVISMAVTNIKFNWDTNSSASDAINIRQDYSNAYDISNGEWVKGGTNIPACYTINKSATITARFTVQPADVTSADIWATAIGGGSLGDVLKTNVAFSGGVSDYVTFRIFDTMPDCVQKTALDVWQWKMENVNGSGSTACNLNTSGVHTVYTILAEPVSPWVNTAGSQKNAWTKALDFDIESASCDGDSTISNAMGHIITYLHGNGFGMTYDTTNGVSHYGMWGTGGDFDLTAYMNGSGCVNCYDQAAGVLVCTHLLGGAPSYLFMSPFGYILQENLVGVGQCNNPFFNDYTYTNRIHTALVDGGTSDRIMPERSGFGNHAIIRNDGMIYDATCGPHSGAETLLQYATSSIDITSPNERPASPDGYGWGGDENGVFSTAEVDSAISSGNVGNIH